VGIYARNWGAATHEVAEGIHRPLTATTITLQSRPEESPLVLVSMDLGWWRTKADEWHVRGGLIEALSLDPAQVMIHFTHTHSGPALCREDAEKPGGHLIAPYLDRLREAVIESVQSALAARSPAVLTWNYGKCNLAQNRDLPDPEHSRYLSGFHPDGFADDTLLLGRVTDPQGKIQATLVNYACHPVTLAWENRLISPDFVGAMREMVEEKTDGAPCLFLQGASGELAPRDQYTADLSVADRNGRILAYAALSTLETMMPPTTGLYFAGAVESGAPLGVWKAVQVEPSSTLQAMQIKVEFPLKAMPSLEELDEQLRRCEDPVMAERIARKRRIRRDMGDGKTVEMPLWIWRVGDALLFGHPNEAYSLFQEELRQEFPEFAVVVMNVTNGHYGYLPPERLYPYDLYPIWQTPFDQGSLEILIQNATDAASQLISEAE
jgi:hypothetical protein